jgi:hypothetical protein
MRVQNEEEDDAFGSSDHNGRHDGRVQQLERGAPKMTGLTLRAKRTVERYAPARGSAPPGLS